MEENEKGGKKLLIALIILVLLLLAALFWFLFFFKGPGKEQVKEQPKTEQPATSSQEAVLSDTATSVKQIIISTKPETPAASQSEIEKANLEKVASLFAERLGSYSNQSDFGNITDLDIFMTESMRAWADSYVKKARADMKYDGLYQGVMTKAVLSQVSEFDNQAGLAKATVQTQRIESSAEDVKAPYYEDLAITFKKENSIWLVDFAKWQGRKDN